MVSFSTWWMWLLFFVIVLAGLSVDFFISKGRKAHKVSMKEALLWSCVWIALALVFNFFIWYYLHNTQGSSIAIKKAVEFFTAYVLEKSLSIDNVFVFIMIFNYFAIPTEYQRRVLLFGVLGAIVMRLLIILFGIYLVNEFHWVLYVFGFFLAVTGVKMLIFSKHDPDLSKNFLVKWMSKHCRITHDLHGERFFIRRSHLLYMTPLFLALIFVEVTDLIFAVDSIPAVFAITRDEFIVFTSNIFAILGLRMLYFLFAHVANRFRYLKYGIAAILIFIGLKMLLAYWYQIPIVIALLVIMLILGSCIVISLYKNKSEA